MGSELGGNLGGVGHDVDARLPLLAQLAPPGVGPDHHAEPNLLRFLGERPNLLVHDPALGGARVDGESDGGASETQGLAHAARDRGKGIPVAVEDVVIVGLQNQRNLAGVPGRPRLQETQGSGVCAASGLEGELKVIEGVVTRGIGGEAAGRSVLEPLIHRQDHQTPRSPQTAVAQDANQIRPGPGGVAFVPAQDLRDAFPHAFLRSAGRWRP